MMYGTTTLIDYRREATGDMVTTNKALGTIIGLKGARHRLHKVDRKPEGNSHRKPESHVNTLSYYKKQNFRELILFHESSCR